MGRSKFLMMAIAGAAAVSLAVQSVAVAAASMPSDGSALIERAYNPQPLLITLICLCAGTAMLFRSRWALFGFAAALAFVSLGIDIAFAADAGTPETVAQATGETTKVTWAVGTVVSQWADAIEALVIAGVAFLLRKIPGQIGNILMTMHVDQIINKGIDYAINMVKGATKDKELSLDVGNAVLAKALQYVLDHAPTWLQSWMGGPDQIAQKIIARLNLAPDAVPDAGAAQLAASGGVNIQELAAQVAKMVKNA